MGGPLACEAPGISTFSIQGEVMKKTIARVREPSTWAGFAAVLEGLKLFCPQYAIAIAGVQAIAGGVAVVMRESGGKPVDAGQ